MILLLFDLKLPLIAILAAVLMCGTVSCAKAPRAEPPIPSDFTSRNTDPESVAMEAFARAHLLSIDGDFEGSLEAIEQAIAVDPDSAFLYMSKAEILLHLGQLEQAKRALEDTLVRDPAMLDAYLTLSEIQTAKGEHGAAIESLTAASRLAPDKQQITLALALAYARNQEFATATSILNGLIETVPDYVDARLALARIYQMSSLPLLSVDSYRALLQVDPGHEQAALELGALYMEMNQPDQAVALFVNLLESSPDSIRIRYQLVRFYLDQNRLDLAREQLSIIIAQDPTDLDALHKVGLIHLQQQNPEQAEQVFRKIVELNPVDEAFYSLGIALEESAKWAEALQTFERITGDSDRFPDAVIHRAYLLPKLDRRQEAIALLSSQISSLESMPELYEYLASLYGKDKAWPLAQQTLDAGLQQFPENTSLLMRRALLLDLAGETQASLASARKVLELEPENSEALNFIAYSYAVQNIQLDQALLLVLKALELTDAPHVRDTYAWVLYRQGNFDEALVQLNRALSGMPDDPTILEHLGDIYMALERVPEALAAYRKSLATGTSADPDALRQKIDSLRTETPK